jgi:hypothetical protein
MKSSETILNILTPFCALTAVHKEVQVMVQHGAGEVMLEILDSSLLSIPF